LAALIASILGTILIRRWAIGRGFVDQPGHRKIHEKPIALGGGIVIFWITMGPVAVVEVLAVLFKQYGVPGFIPETLAIHIPGLASRAPMVLVLFLGAAALHIMGLIDDRKHLGPWSKLIVQFAVAIGLATLADIRFDFFIPSPLVTTILSVLWMIVIINAFNFLDNMDGLSAGIAAICAAMLLTASYNSGQVFVSGLLVLLIGALLGFLVFNFAPAKIFMGDAGSLVVGMLIAVATIRTTYYQEEAQSGPWFAAFMPLVVLAIPLYDFTSVVILRLLQGKSPFVGDKQHFSHRLVNRGMTHRQAVLTIYLATAGTGLGATFLNQVNPGGAVLVLMQTLLIVLIIAILERDKKKNASNCE
jgi:UDP-GlcNAc:undecaprenyl-phosphate GlcNAc-1-phosphate transferase